MRAPASRRRRAACSRARGRPRSLPAFLALADVLASPRVKGANTPFKIYSYLAANKPIVATRILDAHAAPRRLQLAILVEPTAEGLGRGIRHALTKPVDAGFAPRARALLEREYSPARYREKVAQAYAHVEGRPRP